MPRRPSVFVLALTVGDYLLWNWSLNAGHDVLALASGLTLPPLTLVSLWVLAVGVVKAIGAAASLARSARGPGPTVLAARSAGARARPAGTHGPAHAAGKAPAQAARERSGKIAA